MEFAAQSAKCYTYDHYEPSQGSSAWDLNGNGILEMNEANRWYRYGNGQAITVDASKIDLRNVNPKTFANNKTAAVNLLSTGPIYVGVVYGSLNLTYQGNNSVSIEGNAYDFENSGHPWADNVTRNILTIIGGINAGFGYSNAQPFMINFTGLGQLSDNYE